MEPLIDELDYYAAVDRPIFDAEFAAWLPQRVFDVHAHAWLPEHLLRPISEERVGLAFEAAAVPWAALQQAYPLLLPGIAVEWLAFPMPLTVVDRPANNRYIASQIDNRQSFGLYTPGLDEDTETLRAAVRAGRFVGFKPYLSYVTWKPLEAIRVTDFVTPAQVAAAEADGLLIMLHIPRNGRLADPDNLADIRQIATAAPHATIILAHAGRAYTRQIIEAGLPQIADLPNVRLDLSNVHEPEVIAALLRALPLERVMFGWDIPVATVRGRMLMINGQRVCVTHKRFPWSISSEQPGALRCTFMGYEQLRATRQACIQLGLGPEAVEQLFYTSARTLVTSTAARLGWCEADAR